MKTVAIKIALAAAMLVALSGCVANTQSTARNIPLTLSSSDRAEAQNWAFGGLDIAVPRTLVVSEENRIKPFADIIWHEDPCCNRHEQVDRLMTLALFEALQEMSGTRPVQVQLQVTRFHALTPVTRSTYGGEHEIEFILTVRDAQTGAILRGPKAVDITFPAAGGQAARNNEARGFYQRDAINARLAAWARVEFGLNTLIDR